MLHCIVIRSGVYRIAIIKMQKAFTLLEILVVIAMLGILATIIMTSYVSTLKKGRDSRRKQDLEQVGRALELYYFENNAYPTMRPEVSARLTWGESLENSAGTKFYMKRLPQDPSHADDIYYNYDSTDGTYYKLYSCLENTEDIAYQDYAADCGAQCSNCHYGIASSNETP